MKPSHIHIALLVLFLGTINVIWAQKPKQQARELGSLALRDIELGKIEEGIVRLTAAQKLDPNEVFYPNQLARIKAIQGKNYDVLGLLAPWVGRRGATELTYQLYGNALDMLWREQDAINVYLDGLKKFPRSGILYMELGIVEFARGNVEESFTYWLKGAEKSPAYSSNYYWLAKGYAQTPHLARAIIFGEMFLNLEPASERSREISKLIHQVYKQAIKEEKGGGISFHFAPPGSLDPILISPALIPTMQPGEVYQWLWNLGYPEHENGFSFEKLIQAREYITGSWNSFVKDKFDLWIFKIHMDLIQSNNFTAYNYWLFMDALPEEYLARTKSHPEEFERFQKWFNSHPPVILRQDGIRRSWFK